jgi:hypothetical protein
MKGVTDLSPSSVVAVTPTAVTGVLTFMSSPEGPSIRRVSLRSEALSADAYARDHTLSWTSAVDLDCKTRKARLGSTMAYPARDLIGDGHETRAASPAWVTPLVNGAEYNAMLRICDGKAANPLRAAASDPAAAPASAALTAPPPKAAPATATPPPSSAIGPRPQSGPTSMAAPGAVAGLAVVQFGASASQAEAEQVLAGIQRQAAIPAGTAPQVVKVSVNGKTYYRALLAGFKTREDAMAFCRRYSAKREGCFVHGR